MLSNKRIILASKSPRRRQILEEAGFIFEVRAVDIDENPGINLPVHEIARHIAEQKAKQFTTLEKDEILITADTTVVINDTILGKPRDKVDAVQMLSSLSGKSHSVSTGVCIKDFETVRSFTDTTLVQFKKLTDHEIDFYLEKYQPYDKAGAYGIQEWIGMIGITRIEGSYFTVMGLPIHRLYQELQQFLSP